MYKDKEKQKEANRRASQRCRDKAKGMTDVLTNECYVIPDDKCDKGFIGGENKEVEFKDCRALPKNFGQSDCECKHCQNNRKTGSKLKINHGPYKPVIALASNETNRVVLPGDPDYVGQRLEG